MGYTGRKGRKCEQTMMLKSHPSLHLLKLVSPLPPPQVIFHIAVYFYLCAGGDKSISFE